MDEYQDQDEDAELGYALYQDQDAVADLKESRSRRRCNLFVTSFLDQDVVKLQTCKYQDVNSLMCVCCAVCLPVIGVVDLHRMTPNQKSPRGGSG